MVVVLSAAVTSAEVSLRKLVSNVTTLNTGDKTMAGSSGCGQQVDALTHFYELSSHLFSQSIEIVCRGSS